MLSRLALYRHSLITSKVVRPMSLHMSSYSYYSYHKAFDRSEPTLRIVTVV